MPDSVSAALKAFYDTEMVDRATRPLGDDRSRCLAQFMATAHEMGCRSVLEVGCGAGRDGVQLAAAGFDYTGVDLSTTAVQLCQERGLTAVEAVATDLPFAVDSFDAVWSMSTLMHLPGLGLQLALQEIARVTRAGGLVGIGVWGHLSDREWTSPDGRFFQQRTDETLRRELSQLGEVTTFETWDWADDGGHYQWATVVVRNT